MRHLFLIVILFTSNTVSAANSAAVTTLLLQYQSESAINFSVQQGRELWQKKFNATSGETRSCTSCHSKNLTVTGKHIKTKKTIEPMAPSVNSKRLIKIKTIKKWFKRNCKWTLGRECSAQEKGHLLKYIQSQ